MASSSNGADLHPLADIDQVIHAPARLMVLTYLYVVESADYTFLLRMTGLTWGNLATHLAKLEEAGYVAIDKGYQGKKPHSTTATPSLIRLSPSSRIDSRLSTPRVRKKAITATGSVAEIRAPKTMASAMGTPRARLTTLPTSSAVISTPGTASRKIGSHSLRSVRRLRRSADQQ